MLIEDNLLNSTVYACRPVRRDLLAMQARIEAVGQVLMWKAVEAAPGLQRLGRRSRRPARAASDRYEEHMLLPDDRVALLTNQRFMLVSAPGFAKVGKAHFASQSCTWQHCHASVLLSL